MAAGAAVTAEVLLHTDDPRPRVRCHTCVLRPACLFPSKSESPKPAPLCGGAVGPGPALPQPRLAQAAAPHR